MSAELALLHGKLAVCPGELEPLIQRVHRIEAINRACQQWSSEPWMRALRVVNLRGDTLVVHSDSAAALTALRYRRETLLSYLREHHQLPFARLITRVNPKHPRPSV